MRIRSAAGLLIVVVLASAAIGSAARAAPFATFKGRLSPLPINPVTAPLTTGVGSLIATLDGTNLAISGTFEGMNSPATTAKVRRAPKGLRGPAVWDLTVTRATHGTFTGTFALTATQAEDVMKSWYYVQIATEQNPDGQLRGWILK
jgi:hypothetical protein